MKSILRVIRNIRSEDDKKQEAINFIVGEKVETQNALNAVNQVEEMSNSDGYQYYKLKDVSTDYHPSQ